MASSFDQSTRVLSFRPNPEPRKYAQAKASHDSTQSTTTRVLVLWPAYMRLALVRRQVLPRTNLFQLHLLRLCRAGIRDREELARLLGKPESPDIRQDGIGYLTGRILEELIRN